MQPPSPPCKAPAGRVSRLTRALRRSRLLALVIALTGAAAALVADPYPPYWGGGAGPSVHYPPTPWPAGPSWIAYTRDGSGIADKSVSDGSNGGTSPQSYVNVSSGCTDETLPSVYYAFNPGAQVLYFRWRVQAPPHNYATGPNAGSYAAGSPWSSALWTVFIDTNGDGFRDFAVHLDGSSGGPATSIDRIASFYSTTKNQSLDYINDPRIKLLFHNPAAFIDGPSGSDRILNFQNSATPTPQWPNGSNETVWDYGTTRATLLNTGCGEYFIDYQIPLSMLDASAQGGPVVTANTPMSLFFATANGLNNPLQKDIVLAGDFLADPGREVPGGDTITPAGGTILQPTVLSVSAVGCSATALAASIFDTLNNDRTTSVASASFHYYADANANGIADDGSAWTLAANAVTANNPVGRWTASWNSSALIRGQYLIGVKATDAQGNVTWSYLTPAEVAGIGATPPNYANGTGVIATTMNNTCGSAGPSVSKTVSPSIVAAGQPVTFTVTVSNPLSTAMTVASITDTLPAGFTYQSTSGAGTIGGPATSPTVGAGGAVTWTFGPATVAASGSATLIFTANASSVAGSFANSISAATSSGTLTASGTQIGVGSAALTLSKSANVSTAAPGDAVTYTITYSNDSPVNVTNAVITDVLPVGLDYVSASNGGSYAAGTRTVTWNKGAIASGAAPGTVTITATFTSPYPGGAANPLVNTAGIASTEASTSSASSSVFVLAPLGQLRVQKQGNVSQVVPGGNVIYTLSYANIGNAASAGATLSDVIPAGWSFVSTTGGGSNAGGTVTWNLGSLAASATGSVTLTLQASNPYTGANPSTNVVTLAVSGLTSAIDGYTVSVTQTGQVCSDYYFRSTTTGVGFDGTQPIANTTAVTAASAGGSVSATSTGSGNTVEAGRFYQDPAVGSQVNFSAGSTLTSDIYIDRVNGPGVNVTGSVYDYNPATGARTLIGSTTQLFGGSAKGLFSFSTISSGALQAGHRLLWLYTFASANTQSVTLYLQFGGTATNPASGGTTVAISKSRFCTTAAASPILNKQVNTLVASPGSALVYTIGFANAGGTDMTTAQIVDTLPSGVTFTSATLNGVPITPSGSGQVRTFTVRSSDTAIAGQVTGGQSGTLVVNASVTLPFTGSTGILTNAVQLTSTQTSAVNDAITTNLQQPVVTISKSVNDTSWTPGDTVTYTLQVVNGGPGPASAVTVTDVLPTTAYFTYVAGSARLNNVTISPEPVSGGTLTKNIGALAAGATATISFDMLVASSGAPSGVSAFSNTATVSDAGSSGTRSSNTVNATLSTNPNLALTKTSSPSSGPVAPGSVIDYTLTVTNSGSGGATNVLVRDAIPGSTSYNAGTLQNGGVAVTDVVDGDGGHFDGSGNQVVFEIAALAGGASRTFTYRVTVVTPLSNGTTTISSTATVTASNASTRTATASIQASAAPVLTLVKSGPAAVSFPLTTLASGALGSTTVTVVSVSEMAVGSTVSIGGTAAVVTAVVGTTVTLSVPVTAASGTPIIPTWEYRLDFENTGTAPATNVVVTDALPAGLRFLSATAGGVASGGTVTWTLGTVPAGTSDTLRVRARADSAGLYVNAATLVSSETATVTSNSTSTAAGALSVTKTTTTPSGSTSGNVTTATYVIAVQNQSPTTAAAGVTIADVLAPGFTYSSTTSLTGATASTSPSIGDSQPTWTGLAIPANGTATLTFVATLRNVPAGTYQNELSVTTSSLAVVGFDALSSTAEDVTLAATIGSTGTVVITPVIVPGGTLTIRVDDADLDTDALAVETVQVTVVNTRTGESELVMLTETGASTGIFSGALTTGASGSAGANNAPPLNVATSDTVTASYADALTSTGATATTVASSSVVTAVNSNPTANADAATVLEDSSSTVVSVLTNDSSAPDIGETLTVTAITQGTSGGVVVLVGGVVSYTPAANFAGTETFTYTIGDGNGGTATATVTMTVTNVNDNPTANADAATVLRGSGATVVAVLANDSSAPDTGETLTVMAISQGTSGGGVTLVGGVVSYTPVANFTGTETFTYTIGDGNGGTATATVTMTVTNSAPAVVTMTASPSIYVENSGAVVVDAALTVTDIDSPILVGAAVRIASNFVAAQDVLAFASQSGITGVYDTSTGTLILTGSATLAQYEAALRAVTYLNTSDDPSAAPRTISVVVNDGTSDSNIATRTLIPQAVNDAPTLDQPAAITVDEDSGDEAVTLTGISSGAPDETQTLTVTAVSSDTTLFTASAVSYASPASTATLILTPQPDAFGSGTVTVTVSDGGSTSGSVIRTIAVTIRPINDQPTLNAIPDRNAVVPGTLQSVPLDGIGTGAANEIQTLTVTAVSSNPSIVANPVVAYSSPSASGTLQLTPLAPGSAVITVTVNDGDPENPTVTRAFRIGAGPDAPPTITPIAPLSMIEGQSLAPSAFTVDDDITPFAQLTVTAVSSNTALVASGGIAFRGTGANRTITVTPQPYRNGEALITLTVSDGALTATTTFSVTVRPSWDYYLTEGATANTFVTDIRVTNPHEVTAPIHLTFVRDDGGMVERAVDVPAGGMESIRINDLPGLESTGVSTFIRSVDGLPLLVERTMLWGESGHGGHAETALHSTNTRWYFAEGVQSNTLSTWLVIANPNLESTPVRVTFLRGDQTATTNYLLPPVSRQSVALSAIPGLGSAVGSAATFGIVVESDLPTVAERATYLVGARLEGGTVSAGVPYPATDWYFAEGSSWQIFSTYVLVANPNPEAAQVTIRYNTMSGLQRTSRHSIAGYSRITVDTMAAAPGLDGEHYWMQVTADRPVVAERVMYWDRRHLPFIEAHNSHGLYEPAIHWTVGDGRVGGAEHFQTFLLLGNPASQAAELRVTYHRRSADPIVTTRRLGAGLRANIQVNVDVPQLSNESFWITVESTNAVPIVVERSVYWDSEGIFTRAGTNVLAVPGLPTSSIGCEVAVSPRTVSAPAGGMGTRIQVSATSPCTYTATSSAAWIVVTSGASGFGLGVVELAVAPNASGATRTGTVTVGADAISIAQVAAEPPPPAAPFGYVDTPGDGSTATGEVAVTGWALDDSGIAGVDLYRSPLAGEPRQANGLILIGTATLVAGARPDILAQYPSYPGVNSAGWGYMLLSNMLPNHGNGTFILSAYVRAMDGASAFLGSKTMTFANAGSYTPFGTIDTPRQGQIVSGTITNFGWALTAQPNSIPVDGSTIAVYVDGVMRGHPTYDNFRSDIAAQFPGYANSDGAVGYFTLDTAALSNGVHTISWAVRDSAGNESGIGSRYFTVSNPAIAGR